MGDLDGTLVVSVEQAVAAPYAAGRLAGAGARVIKVERPEGDFARRYDKDAKGLSAYFVWLNHGKESICLDLKQADDLTLLKRMIAKADVFIQNLVPGATERLGIGSEGLRAAHPRLITCDISGYGQEGPYKDMKAYDLLIQAESGLAEINGSPEQPGRVGVSVCDIAAGMTAFQAILQALFARERSGRGRGIQVSLFHAMADWMNVPYLQHRYGGRQVARCGLHHPTIAPYGAYACRDARLVLISIQNEREWRRLCAEALEKPGLADDPRFAGNPERVANRPALDAEIAGVFGRLDRDAVVARLESAQIAYGRLSSLEDLQAHPQKQLLTVQTSGGEVELLAPGAVVLDAPEIGGRVPDLGEQSAKIRAEFGGETALRSPRPEPVEG
ncbi:MAG: CoA transferase [Kiloniellales bacterium]|nr:CoA transferase [Kiloniellales bacterium]